MDGENVKKYLEKGFGTALLFTLFFCPLIFSTHANDPFWVVEKFFLKFSVSALALIFIALCWMKREFPVIKTPYNVAFIVFVAANIAGLFTIGNIYAFMDRLYVNLCFLIIFHLSVYYISAAPEKNTKKIILAVVLSGFFMASYGLIQALGLDFMPWKTNFAGRAASTLGNPNFLAGHMLILLPLTYTLFLVSRGSLEKFGLLVIAGVLTAALLASQTRGAYIGWAVSLVLLFIMLAAFEKESFAKNIKLVIAFMIILTVLAGGYMASNRNALQRIKDIITLKDESAHIRASLWKNSMYLIRDNFFLGSGAGNFYIKYSFYQSKSLAPGMFKQSDFYKSGHAHNDFIQFFAEYGFFGAGAMFFFFFLVYFTGFKFLKKEGGGRAAVIGVLAGSAGLMTHAVFNFPFQILPTAAVFYSLIALASFSQGDALVENKPASVPVKLLAGLAALALITAAVLSARVLAADFYLRKAKESEYFVKTYDAVSYASDAADLNPWNDEVVFYYAQMLDKTGAFEKAFETSKAAVRLNPGSWEALLQLFNMYAMKNEAAAGSDIADKLYAISPYSEKAISIKGFNLYSRSKFDEAAGVYETGLKVLGEKPSLLSQLAAVYGAMGNTPKTIEYANRALSIDPNYTDANFNLAVVYYRMKNFKAARENLDKILRLNPSDEKAKGLLKAVENERKK